MKERFLHIQIWDSTEENVEYDNKVDTTWGIASGSASLESAIMNTEIHFGELNSAMFQVQIFGIDVDLSDRRIKVTMDETSRVYGHFRTDSNEIIVTDSGSNLAYGEGEEVTINNVLFDGWIDSCKKDYSGIYRDIIAYDWIYYHRNDNVASWWNTYWANTEQEFVYDVRDDLLTSAGPIGQAGWGRPDAQVPGPELNYHIIMRHVDCAPFQPTTLSFATVMEMFGELQAFSVVIDPSTRTLKWISLSSATTYDESNNVEGQNSDWEDYTTNTITGVALYDTSDNLMELVGTGESIYKIVGNLIITSMDAYSRNVVLTAIKNYIDDYTYTPARVKLIESDLSYKLGDKIHTDMGDTYIFKQIFSGSLFVDQTIEAHAQGPNLNADVQSHNQELIDGYKISKISQSLDGIETEVSNLKDGSSVTISQLANAYVVKLKDNGQLAKAQLVGSGSGTEFKVEASNIAFVASNNIMLTAASGIGIYSPNFSVTPGGTISSKAGDIAGWTIISSMLYKEITSGSGSNQITYRTFLSAPDSPGTSDNAFGIRKKYTEQGVERTVYPFKVTYGGRVEATDGNIAGWEFDDTMFYRRITSGGITYRPFLNAPANPTTDNIAFGVAIKDGDNPMTYPFRVNYDGSLTATNAKLYGGTIAGWNITSDNINYTNSSHDYIVFANGSNANKDVLVVRTGTSGNYKYPFWINADGFVHAESGDIAGWELSEDTMTSTNGNDRAFLRKPYANGAASDWIFAVQHKNSSTQNWDAYWYVNGNGAMYVGSTARLIGGVIIGSGASGNVPGISFRYNDTTSDYTLKLRQMTTGTLDVIQDSSTWGRVRALSFDVQSSIKVKENIRNIPDEEAKKILNLRTVSFDYTNGVKDNRGLIAEEVMEILPNMVNIPDGYDPENVEDLMNVPSIDYSKFVPYLIKMVQIQQEQINELYSKQ